MPGDPTNPNDQPADSSFGPPEPVAAAAASDVTAAVKVAWLADHPRAPEVRHVAAHASAVVRHRRKRVHAVQRKPQG